MTYTSSIINKYGDMVNVRSDASAIREIQSRQGNDFLLDVIAEITGEGANRMKFSDADRAMLIKSLVISFKEALQERL